jgi:SAM-dependent methyltransferase
MHNDVSADANDLRFRTPVDLDRESVDVLFGVHRVWSPGDIDAVAGAEVRLAWPEALLPHLNGTGEIRILRPRDGSTLASGTVSFGAEGEELSVVDALGRWLAVNKWDRLGVVIDGQDAGLVERIVAHARTLVDDLQNLGYRPFVCSGSLLGAVRNGRLLPHDDDIDLGLLSDHHHPADLILENLELERRLIERGYLIIRHSYAHMQVTFLHPTGDVDHYVDIFTAYFDADGMFNQPFSVRGRLRLDELEPFARVTLEGEEFPAPKEPGRWLELNYGPSWQIPDPGFRFEVPEGTFRRFETWFGAFNLHRDYWSDEQSGQPRTHTSDSDRVMRQLLAKRMPGDLVVDVGCGLSTLPSELTAEGFEVVAVDFSLPALHAQEPFVATRSVNLNDRRQTLGFAYDLLRCGRRIHFVLNHTLTGLAGYGSDNVYLLLRWVLRNGGGVAVMTVDTELPPDHRFDDPESWHIPVQKLIDDGERHGLDVEIVAEYQRLTRGKRRNAALAVVSACTQKEGTI